MPLLARTRPRHARTARPRTDAVVNDVHSRLNATRVAGILRPTSLDGVVRAVAVARRERLPLVACGARHSMGGQQFATDGLLLDTSRLDRVLRLDRHAGLVEVEAGIQWPELVGALADLQPHDPTPWVIRQKQTGADRLSLGGALASNVHGRGLRMRPFIGDVESFTLVDAEARVRTCSRTHDPELFALVAGGHGLFGIVYSLTLRLARRQVLQRRVELASVDDVVARLERHADEGALHGDFQFAVDARAAAFLRDGVTSTYHPVDAPMPEAGRRAELSERDWRDLVVLAHHDKPRAFARYVRHYLSTSGQTYGSDTHQLATYLDGYHDHVDARLGRRGSEVITELYVPRPALPAFMEDARELLRGRRADVIYGTVRLIERDGESFLAWAREPWACVVLNLHVDHAGDAIARSRDTFRDLIDLALRRRGSYSLTYHRHATPAQAEAAHPRLRRFLELKRGHDPELRFQSDWWRRLDPAGAATQSREAAACQPS